MTRREFVVAGVVGVAGVVLVSMRVGSYTRGEVRRVIRARLGDWTISNEHLDTFLKAYQTDYGPPNPGHDDFLQVLILSTDAFAEGRSDRVLRFVHLYHPYTSPCYNPLARV